MVRLKRGNGTGSKWLLGRNCRKLGSYRGKNPNFLTIFGAGSEFWRCESFAVGRIFRTGALIISLPASWDMWLVRWASAESSDQSFGAFYDSTLDSYADMDVVYGLMGCSTRSAAGRLMCDCGLVGATSSVGIDGEVARVLDARSR